MPIQITPTKTKYVFAALEAQPTLQAPFLAARVVTNLNAGFMYECILTARSPSGVTWAALKTNVRGLSAEWVKVEDETTSKTLGIVAELL